MTKITLFWPLLLLTGCSWVLTHPTEDAEAVGIVEEAAKEVYQYETKTLSPSPQPGVPPMKIPGASGPGGHNAP